MPKVVTVFQRVREYEKVGFYVFDKANKIMMCKLCNVIVDWKDTCEKHVNARASHEANKKRVMSEGGSKRQTLISETLDASKRARQEKEQFTKDTVRAFVKANIPLFKVDHPAVSEWMEKYIPGAGSLPHSKTLRDVYLKNIGEEEEVNLKEVVKG
ncbi:CGG triplet repeat-binding protein 1-like [Ischnura elegans]|uniref:CGG triplet repeat-binding protein 1-like n=1 Tax=Ischnura elegans TaxID=197161 RepID=UPI001ED8BF25|nr:CGG triplet repeat-binding protein 1-like [Ischnura elegans]